MGAGAITYAIPAAQLPDVRGWDLLTDACLCSWVVVAVGKLAEDAMFDWSCWRADVLARLRTSCQQYHALGWIAYDPA